MAANDLMSVYQSEKQDREKMANKAYTGFAGVRAIYRHFPGFGFSYISSRIHARPAEVNANCWALNCDYAAVVLIKIAIWRSEYKNTLIDVLLDKENSD